MRKGAFKEASLSDLIRRPLSQPKPVDMGTIVPNTVAVAGFYLTPPRTVWKGRNQLRDGSWMY